MAASRFVSWFSQPLVTRADGTRIAFSQTTPGFYRADIYTSLPDGTDLQRVTNTPDNEMNIDWGVGDE